MARDNVIAAMTSADDEEQIVLLDYQPQAVQKPLSITDLPFENEMWRHIPVMIMNFIGPSRSKDFMNLKATALSIYELYYDAELALAAARKTAIEENVIAMR